MNVLLLSMPDSFEHMPPVAIRMPNGALTSLAGNVDPHHRVSVADLILAHRHVRETVTQLVRELDPEVVGLSIMTFQRRTAGRIIELVRALRPEVKIVVGGYDPSLAPEAYEDMGVDYLVRSEGEVTFRELLRAVEQGSGVERICGLSWRNGESWVHNPARPPHRLEERSEVLALAIAPGDQQQRTRQSRDRGNRGADIRAFGIIDVVDTGDISNPLSAVREPGELAGGPDGARGNHHGRQDEPGDAGEGDRLCHENQEDADCRE